MAYSHKNQSFMKNGSQQKCLDKALIKEHLEIFRIKVFVVLKNFYMYIIEIPEKIQS